MIKLDGMILDEIEAALNAASDKELDDFIERGFDGISLDGSQSPFDRGYFDGTGDLAWTYDEYIIIDMYTDRREDMVCRGRFDDIEKRGW